MQLSLIFMSALLISLGLSLPMANNMIVEEPSIYYDQIVLTNETMKGRHPCALGSDCECLRNGKSYKQVLVYCSEKNLTKTHRTLVAASIRVVYLEMSMNKIKEMPDMTRNGYQFVKVLVLNDNRIKTIDETSISKNLQMLLLEGNQITRVDQAVINKIHASKLWWFSIVNNPIICDCDSLPWIKFVKEGKKKGFCLGPQWTNCAYTSTLVRDLKIEEVCSNTTTVMPSTHENANSSLVIIKKVD